MLLQLVVSRLLTVLYRYSFVTQSSRASFPGSIFKRHVTLSVYLNRVWGTCKYCLVRQLAWLLNHSSNLWVVCYFCPLCLLFLSVIYNPHVASRAPAPTRPSVSRKLLPVDNTLSAAQWSPGSFLGLWCKSLFCSFKAFSSGCMKIQCVMFICYMLFSRLFNTKPQGFLGHLLILVRMKSHMFIYQVWIVLVSVLIIMVTCWMAITKVTLGYFSLSR